MVHTHGHWIYDPADSLIHPVDTSREDMEKIRELIPENYEFWDTNSTEAAAVAGIYKLLYGKPHPEVPPAED
jgi:hypothetical protein